jgi:hypothetical protein
MQRMNFASVIEEAGHDKMSDKNSAQCQAAFVHFQLADLRVHSSDDATCGFGVIAGHEIFSAMLGVPPFEIGHVDVDQTVHPLNALQAVVS